MRQSIGGAFTINLIAVFIVLVFAFLAGTLSYTKAFRVNSRIVNAIERYEGYNTLSKAEIDRTLSTFGYLNGTKRKCAAKKNGGILMSLNENFNYCIYYNANDGGNEYYSYGVITYIYIELPIIGSSINIPIYSKTNRIYRF